MNNKAKRTANHDAGIMTRVVIAIVLSLTLVGVLRWSMNVTRANAKQISHNLSQIQQQMDSRAVKEQDGDDAGAPVHGGPSIDPIGNGSR